METKGFTGFVFDFFLKNYCKISAVWVHTITKFLKAYFVGLGFCTHFCFLGEGLHFACAPGVSSENRPLLTVCMIVATLFSILI